MVPAKRLAAEICPMYRTPNQEAIAKRLREFGIVKMAERLGISRAAVSQWANGWWPIPPARVPRVAKHLNCKMYDLRPDIFPPNV